LAAWTREEPSEILCKSPRIHRRGGFLSPAIRAWIIARGAGRLSRARVFDPNAEGLLEEEARTNSAVAFRLAEMDVIMALVRLRIAATLEVGTGALEPPQVLHYEVGQRFEPHYDFFDPALPGHVQNLTGHGQRTSTFLIYLNDDFDGGETDFPILGQSHKAPAGGALWFYNTQASGTPDRRTLHAGLPPTRGEKWLLSQWVRERPRT
jgi:predicted 2-oxoglutarate/Fe(II)-dependent dioxygenase YbiX